MKRKLFAIWSLLRCKNYTLITYKDKNLHYDHTMHENDCKKYCKYLLDHYEDLDAGQELVLIEAKNILGLKLNK